MADKIHITKSGFQALSWDGDVGQYLEAPISNILRDLRTTCYIDSGVTLWDIFRIVDSEPALKEFLGNWSWCDVDAFHREIELEPATPSNLSYLEVSKYFEWSQDDKYKLYDAHENISFGGMGKPDGEYCGIEDENGNVSWGIDFTPVNEMRHLPVKLNPKMPIFKNHEKLGEAECYFSLLDVLGEIYYEISFYGSPSNRNEKGAEIRQAADEVKNGTATLVPWEPDDGSDLVQ